MTEPIAGPAGKATFLVATLAMVALAGLPVLSLEKRFWRRRSQSGRAVDAAAPRQQGTRRP